MPKITTAFIAALIGFSLVACQKDSGKDGISTLENIQGNYKFISLEAKTSVTELMTEGGVTEKLVTLSEYKTKNNSGTVKIDATSMTSNKLSYSIDTVVKAYYYINNVLDDSFEMPFNFNLPASSSSAPYKLVGSDSIYFSAGTLFIDGSAQQPTVPGGSKLSVEGKKLYMTTQASRTSTQNMQGHNVLVTTQVAGKVTLEKL